MSKNISTPTILRALAWAALLALPATAPRAQDIADADAPALSKAGRHYIVTRPDLRKCAFPQCGGVYVKAVNQALTLCADNRWQRDCRVALLDSSALGWDEATAAKFKQRFDSGHALARGTLRIDELAGGRPPVLRLSEGWDAQADSKPSGTFYALKNSGIVCITTPCPTVTQARLNGGGSSNIAEVDLAASGADKAAVEAGLQALNERGVLAAGTHRVVTGPAGRALGLVASEFYLAVPPQKP